MKKKRKRTRTECFQMIGKIEHIQRICSTAIHCELVYKFTKRELHG